MQNHQRFHGLDFARAVLMLLGIFYHASIIYTPELNWGVKSAETFDGFTYSRAFLLMFRMESFFLISGFFYYMLYLKGRDHFLSQRLARTLIPLFIAGFTLNLGLHVFFLSHRYTFDIDYLIFGQWLDHLWFLGNLSVYFILSYPVAYVVKKLPPFRMYQFMALSLILALGAVVGLAISNNIYNGNFLIISCAKFFYYYAYFLLGILAFKNLNVFKSLLQPKALFFFAVMLITLVTLTAWQNELPKIITIFSKNLIPLPLTFLAIAFLNAIGQRQSSIVQKISDASYTLYLLHQPLLILLYLTFLDNVHLGVGIEYSLLTFTTFITAYAFHRYCVANNQGLRFLLNGVPVRPQSISTKTTS